MPAVVAPSVMTMPGFTELTRSCAENAKRAMTAGDHVKACGLFRESLRFDRAVGTLLNLALCEEKIGERSNALKHYLAAEARTCRGV